MKRIASLVMAMLMVVTTFCGILSVTSTAYLTENAFETTVIASEVAEDGTFDVEVWAKDNNADYGFERFGFELLWDEDKVEPVTTEVTDTSSGKLLNAWFEVSAAYDLVKAINAKTDELFTAADFISVVSPLRTTTRPITVLGYYVCGAAPYNYLEIGFAGNTINNQPISFNEGFWIGGGVTDTSGLNLDAEKGALLGKATFKVLEGATGDVTITANPVTVLVRGDDYIKSVDVGAEACAVNSAVVTIPATEEPSAVTLVTDDAASIRTNAPAGIRFSGEITATDWTGVTEFGIRLSKGETTLDIPATVDATGAVIDIEALTEGQTVEFNAVLSGLKETNYAADFTATAYVKYEDGSEELGNAVVKNAADTAVAALADASAEYTAEQKAYLETLAAAAA